MGTCSNKDVHTCMCPRIHAKHRDLGKPAIAMPGRHVFPYLPMSYISK
jgi:hypothetical protein